MARLKTGDFHVLYFDRYGERIKGARHVQATSVTRAIRKGRRYGKRCGYHSFRVDRAVFNSLDEDDKW